MIRPRKFEPLKNFAIRHIVGLMAFLFFIGILVIVWYLNQLSEIQIRSTAIKNSQILSETLTRFRQVYTSEVVPKAKSHGLVLSHNYKNDDDAIPLPATMSLLLGNKRQDGGGNMITSKLSSPYPFPWKKESGGLDDKFLKDAWQSFLQKPNKPFYRFEMVGNRTSLRYATADIMRESCVQCHNSHPDSPKTDWQVGQVRGILEIVVPVDTSFDLAKDMMQQTLLLLAAMAILTLFTIGIVVSQLRTLAKRAENQADRASEVNKQLANEVKIRKKVQSALVEMSYIDGLLGIANRRKFDEVYSKEWSRAQRNKTPIGIILLDIDYFKKFNDNYGHQAGDSVLIEVAQIIDRQLCRPSDLVARYGGEEFIVLLPETSLEGAINIAKQIIKALSHAKISHQYSDVSEFLTLSAGVQSRIPMPVISKDSLIHDADQALYQAKEQGRNRLCYGKS